MEPGITIKSQDKTLFDMIANIKTFDVSDEIDIRVADMKAFGMNEEALSVTLARAYKAKRLNVLYRLAHEDLYSEEHLHGSPVVARILLLDASPISAPATATSIGDFAYIQNGVGDVTLYWKNSLVSFGPKSNKVIQFLLKNNGRWKNAEDISLETGASARGLSELVRSANERVTSKTNGCLKILIECDKSGLYRIDT